MNASNLISLARQFPTIFICGLLSVIILAAIVIRGGGLSDTRAQLEQVARDGARIDDNIKNAVDLEQHLESLNQITDEISARLISPAELARNLQYFYRLETESGVSITDLNQRGTEAIPEEGDAPTYIPVRYEIAVEGQYPNLLDFLYRVETGRHFSRFTQLEIVRTQRADSTAVRLAINLELLGRP